MADELDLDALRAELDEFAVPAPDPARSAVEERVMAGFEEIQRWVDEHGRVPRHGDGLDIFERLYAVRLDRIRAQEEFRTLLASMDRQGLLDAGGADAADADALSDDELAAELAGIGESASELTTLRHVRPRAEIQAAEEIATRKPCADFAQFEPLFTAVEADIRKGVRTTLPFNKDTGYNTDARVRLGDFYILGGQYAYVAEMGHESRTAEGAPQAHLRVIFNNGTESDLLLRSLQAALYKDPAGRRVTTPAAGPLFDHVSENELSSGIVYVLRSKSDHPEIASRRDLIHKIGVTSGDVRRRIADAERDATYLLADVELVTTYHLYHINPTKLESVLHRVFERARLEITIPDRFGNPVSPREWFLVPLFVIDDAIERIKDGSIMDYIYNPAEGSLVRAAR